MDYKSIFNRIEKLNIMIIGDVMIDAYQWGKVERISPEAPVPICSVTKEEDRLGGAGNVALNISSMGAEPILCSVIGQDNNGEILLNLLKENNMTTEGIVLSKTRPTTIKTRVLGNNTQMLRVDKEIIDFLNTEEETDFLKTIFDILNKKRIDAIIFQDYDKGVITENVISQIVSKANERQIPTTVDPKKRNFKNYKNVTMFKPNLKELKEGLKIEFTLPTMDNLSEASLLLNNKQRIEKVFITLSEYGVFIADYKQRQAKVKMISAHLRNIADVSGAGDTVISVATLCLAVGLEAEDIARISNLAGGLVCETVGVTPINKERLYKELLSL
ncbi:MAG: bifunctional ADP-heptose synthase [Bacteroidales bacterium]|jgi:rfaE bifunctional protein kinase chain/domain|nr:bifunctional ADP-heptose synthase [Bacteroidales bacterium]